MWTTTPTASAYDRGQQGGKVRIVEENPDSEISLEDVLSELEGLAALHEQDAGDRSHASHNDPTGDADLLMACAERIRNADLDWAAWNRLGMACFRASDGGEAGFAAFEAISRKSSKYDAEATRARWEHYRRSPPEHLSVATLVYEARKADPSFRKKKLEPSASWGPDEGQPAEDGWEVRLAAGIAELNERYFVAAIGGSVRIASMAHDPVLDRERLVFSREADIRLQYTHRHYKVGAS